MPQNATTYFSYISYTDYVIMQSVYIPIGIFGILGNALVLIAYLKYKNMRAIDCAHLIAALSVGNVVTGFGALVISASRLEIALFNDYNYSRFNCIFGAVVVFIGLEMSQTITMAIAIDRLKAVSNPFAYRSANNRLFAVVSFLISILAGLSNIALSVIGVDFSTPPSRCNWSGSVNSVCASIFNIGNALTGPVIAAIYTVVVYKQRKWNKLLHDSTDSKNKSSNSKSLASQAKMTKLFTVLVAVYFVLVAVPLTMLYLWSQLKLYTDFTSNYLSTLRTISMCLNSSLSVLLYASSSSSVRPFLRNVLKLRKNHVVDENLISNFNIIRSNRTSFNIQPITAVG